MRDGSSDNQPDKGWSHQKEQQKQQQQRQRQRQQRQQQLELICDVILHCNFGSNYPSLMVFYLHEVLLYYVKVFVSFLASIIYISYYFLPLLHGV